MGVDDESIMSIETADVVDEVGSGIDVSIAGRVEVDRLVVGIELLEELDPQATIARCEEDTFLVFLLTEGV